MVIVKQYSEKQFNQTTEKIFTIYESDTNKVKNFIPLMGVIHKYLVNRVKIGENLTQDLYQQIAEIQPSNEKVVLLRAQNWIIT